MRHLFSLFAVAYALAAQTAMPPPAKTKVDFIRDVEPILSQKCQSCHGDDAQQSGLRLDHRQNAMRGGDYGPVIIPGKSAESKLIKRLVGGDGGLQMPPTGALPTEEIALLRAWIDQGADWRLEVKEEAPPKPVDPQLQSLIAAVRAGDQAAVSKILNAHPGLAPAQDNGGSTLLHHAAGFASAGMMQLLLDKGADPNATNRRKSTPLHWAIDDEAKVRLLFARHAAIDAKQADGRTPLYQAASIGNASHIVRLLLDRGADPNASTATGATPLMAAANRGDVEVIQLLLSKKAEVNARSGTGGTALLGAASSGIASAVRLLLAGGADPNLTTKKLETALMNAATSGAEESVKLLLEHNAAVNVRDDRGYSALMYAAASDALTVGSVKLLLDKGADPAITAENETARSLAVKRGDTEIARLLGASSEEGQRGGVIVAKRNTPRQIPEAVGKALDLLDKQSHNFIQIGGCNSCHAQDLPSAHAELVRLWLYHRCLGGPPTPGIGGDMGFPPQ